jgi:hypothetical protein
MAARIAMMAITTSNSIRVNPFRSERDMGGSVEKRASGVGGRKVTERRQGSVEAESLVSGHKTGRPVSAKPRWRG